MSFVTSVLVGLLAEHGVSADAFMAPLDDHFRSAGDMPRCFRSDLDPPSMAGSVQSQGDHIAFPPGLPYVAGLYTGGNIGLTAIALSPNAIWYGHQSEASVVLRGMQFPQVLLTSMWGRFVDTVVEHPALKGSGEMVISAHQNGSDVNLRLTNTRRRLERCGAAQLRRAA